MVEPTSQPLSITVTPQDSEEEVANEETQANPTGVDPARLEAFRSGFDIEKASRAGLNDQDIVEYIKEAFPEFDYEAATSEQVVKGDDGEDVLIPGYTDRDVVAYFTKASSAGPAEAILTEAARGITVGTPATLGAVMGAQIGLATGPFSPFFAPTLAIAGLGAGYLFGDKLQEFFLPQEPYAPSVRPYGEAGMTGGSGIPMLFVPSMYASKFIPGTDAYVRNVANLAGRNPLTMDPSKLTPAEAIMRRSVEKPGRYLASELGPLGGASYGALVSEQKYPGDALARLGYEIGLGTFSPVTVGINLADRVWSRTAAFFSDEAQKTRQGVALVDWLKRNAPVEPGLGKEASEVAKTKYVQTIFDKLNQPDEVQKIAAEMGIKMPKRTTAALLDDPVVLGLQSTLGRDSVDGPRIRAAIARDYKGMANLIDLMQGSGDPTLISEAAKIRSDFFKGLIVKKLDEANLAVINLSKKIDPKDPRAAMRASAAIEDLTNNAIVQIRKFESNLYDAVNKDEIVPDRATSLLGEYSKIEKELLESNIEIPANVRRLIFKARGESVEVADRNASTINRIQNQIDDAQNTIESIGDGYPDSVKAASSFYSESDSPELKVSKIQDAIKALESDGSLARFNIKAPERNRRIKVLESQAKSIQGRLRLDDLSSQRPTVEQPEDISVGELMRARSTLLNDARTATANKDFNKAHYFSDLADALQDDLGVAAGRRNADVSKLTPNQAALRQATDFSRAMNDVFSRAFPSTVLAKTKAGSRRVMPELLSKSIFSGGGDATSLKYDQLEKAMSFADKSLGTGKRLLDDVRILESQGLEGVEDPFSRVGTMRVAQNMLLRNIVSDPKIVGANGKINPEGLANHLREYRNVYFDENNLPRFRDLTNDLQNLQKAQSLVDTTLARKGSYEDAVKNSAVFMQLPMAGTNPQKLIANILGTPGNRGAEDPAGSFRKLIRYAKAADSRLASEGKPTGAKKGILDIVLERGQFFASGTNKNGEDVFDMRALSDYLRKPINAKGDSPMEIMRQEGVLSTDEAVRLNKILNYGVSSQQQRALAGASADQPGGLATRGMDTLFRLFGLRVGRAATKMAPGQGQGLAEPMMVANEFSALLNVPKMKHRDLLIQAMENPDFFRLLLEKGGEGGPKSVRLRNKLNAYLYSAGFISATDSEREKQRREFDPRELRNMLKPVVRPPVEIPQEPPRPQVQSQQQASPTPQPVAQAPAPAPAPASSPMDRARLAAAFPNDPILKLMG